MNIFLILILCFLIGEFLVTAYIDVLNIKHLSPHPPEEFKNVYDPERYKKSQAYLKDNTWFSLIHSGLFTLITIAFILCGGFNTIDLWARSFHLGEIPTGLIFTGILALLMQIINLPFSLYHTFVTEEKYGFNKTTLKTFFLDCLKGLILGAILGGLILAGLIYFFEMFPVYGWLFAWIGLVCFQLFMDYVAPTWIMPLFNKFTPLEQNPLKEAIENYAKAENFALQGVYVMDGSKRSSKTNAFFVGFGQNRRIVLFDTLIEKHTTDELVSVLAHEMGHYKKHHIIKIMMHSFLISGLMLYLFSWVINNQLLFNAFKMEHLSIYASLIFFALLYSPLEFIFGIFSHYFSRKYEFEADQYAVTTYKKAGAMINALKKLAVENLSNLTPHPLKVFISYSHPPVIERINHIKN